MKEPSAYRLSFTAGGLLLRESKIALRAYDELHHWDDVADNLISMNAFGERAATSTKRKVHEIKSRFEGRPADLLMLALECNDDTYRLALWYCTCATYTFIADFARDVVRPKILTNDLVLTSEDYDRFFNLKADWHEELDGLRPSTARKVKQVTFRMLREAGLMSRENCLYPVHLDAQLRNIILADQPELVKTIPDLSLESII